MTISILTVQYFPVRSQSCLPWFLVTYNVFSENALTLVLFSTTNWKTYYWSNTSLEITLIWSSIRGSSSCNVSYFLRNKIFFQSWKISSFHVYYFLTFVLTVCITLWKSKFTDILQTKIYRKIPALELSWNVIVYCWHWASRVITGWPIPYLVLSKWSAVLQKTLVYLVQIHK